MIYSPEGQHIPVVLLIDNFPPQTINITDPILCKFSDFIIKMSVTIEERCIPVLICVKSFYTSIPSGDMLAMICYTQNRRKEEYILSYFLISLQKYLEPGISLNSTVSSVAILEESK